jgi:hypothetical protein
LILFAAALCPYPRINGQQSDVENCFGVCQNNHCWLIFLIFGKIIVFHQPLPVPTGNLLLSNPFPMQQIFSKHLCHVQAASKVFSATGKVNSFRG